jgi:two-component sensor histidine kinase
MQSRIGAIAQLYDLISQSSRGQPSPSTPICRKSPSHVGEPASAPSGIEIEVEAEALEIDPDRAVPFGLLVNELATNAIKHAFPGGTGHVVLSVEQIGDEIELTVSDDGVGMKDKALDENSREARFRLCRDLRAPARRQAHHLGTGRRGNQHQDKRFPVEPLAA